MRKKVLMDSNFRKGKVFKKMIFQNKRICFEKLTLMPYSKILEHEHIEDCEIYIIYSESKFLRVEMCEIGKSHSLENDTEDKMIVYALKFRRWVMKK